MEPYDPDKQYFGPEGNFLSEIIPKNPPGIPQLRSVFNLAAYNHDRGYEGKRRSGWLRLLDIIDRYHIDRAFYQDMADGIDRAYEKEKITFEQFEYAMKYAKISYTAVRGLGWIFFRSSDKNKSKSNKAALASATALIFAAGCSVQFEGPLDTNIKAGVDLEDGLFIKAKPLDFEIITESIIESLTEEEK